MLTDKKLIIRKTLKIEIIVLGQILLGALFGMASILLGLYCDLRCQEYGSLNSIILVVLGSVILFVVFIPAFIYELLFQNVIVADENGIRVYASITQPVRFLKWERIQGFRFPREQIGKNIFDFFAIDYQGSKKDKCVFIPLKKLPDSGEVTLSKLSVFRESIGK